MTQQFALSLGRESPSIFSKFNLFNTDTPSIRTFFMAPSVSVTEYGFNEVWALRCFQIVLKTIFNATSLYLGGYIVRSQTD